MDVGMGVDVDVVDVVGGRLKSKSPRTSCRSGARLRRYSYVLVSVRLPRQRICPILPGESSFLNLEGMSCFCWRGVVSEDEGLGRRGGEGSCWWAY